MSLLPDTTQLKVLLSEESRLRALARVLIEDPATADEAVQETLEQGSEGLLQQSSLRGYLGRALERRIFRHLRSERRRRHHEHQAARPDALPSTIDVVAAAEIRRQLIDAVTGLPEPYRSTIWLRYYEDLPPRKIAERMSVPVNTVHTRVQRGLEQLRRALDARHNGDRRAWTACLTPWAIRGTQTTTLITGILGALLMKKTVLASSGILAAGLVVFIVARSGPVAIDEPDAVFRSSADRLTAGEAFSDRGTTDLGPDPLPRTSIRSDRPAAGPDELLTGTVVDDLGNPVGGIPLRFEPEPGLEPVDAAAVVTEPDGSFAMRRPAVNGSILADDPAYTTLLAGTRYYDNNPVWVVVAPAARVSGTVVHADGTPVPDVRTVVELPEGFRTRFAFPLRNSKDRSWEARSDETGFFQLADVPLMQGCRITWSKTDYAPEKRELLRDVRELRVVLRPLVAEGGELRGIVVDDRGQPVSGAQVALGREVRRTREDGSFRFLVDPGADRLLAVAEGWMPVFLRRAPPGWPAYVELRFARRPMSLSGRVLDEAGTPHGNALVWVEDLTYFGVSGPAALAAELEMQGQGSGRIWRKVATDDQGRFEIPGLMDREYRVRAIDQRTALLTPSGTARAGTDGLVLQFPAGSIHAAVSGRVLDSAGRTVSGMRISVRREVFALHSPEYGGMRFIQHASGARTRSDAEGWFRLEGVPREGIDLSLSGEGVITKRFTFPDDRVPVRFDILVERECRIRIDVSGSEYAAADGARVLDVRGEPLSMERRVPDLISHEETTKLVEGRSEVVVVPDSAAEVLLLRGDEELGRLPVRPDPERLVTVGR